MTSRERNLAILLSTLIAVGVFGMGGYLGVYQPLTERYQAIESLEQELGDKDARLMKAMKDRPRLDRTLKRSLPADLDTARQEYDAAINRLLKDAKVPATYTVKPKATDGKAAPEISPKKPAFTRIALEVTLAKVSYATVLDVLQRYYRLNLLQQITKFTVKKTEDLPSPPLGSSVSDRPDLTVTFVTEAIVLDGAENRKSLLPIPTAAGAAGGGLGYTALFSTAELTRGMVPIKLEDVLANPARDYSPMLVKDIFHGPPPGPRPPPEVPPAPAPKEDTSRFIRLVGLGVNSDGTGTAFIEDVASKQEYVISVSRTGGRLKTEVVKYYYSTKGVKRAYDSEPVLDISDSSSRTARKFKIAGFDGDLLVLLEAATSSSTGTEAVSSRGNGFGNTRRPPSSSAKPTPPSAALVGGSAAALTSDEKVLTWKHGDPLTQVKELSRSDGQKLLSKLAGTSGEDATVTVGSGNSQAITVSSENDR